MIKTTIKGAISDLVCASGIRSGRSSIRALAYHRISASPPSGYPYSVSTKALEAQLKMLRDLGVRVVGTDDLEEGSTQTQTTQALICFEDGYVDALENAVPLLRTFGYRATFFLVSGRMGRASDWETPLGFAPAPIMTWDDARRLVAAGMTIGSHSLNHSDLRTLTDGELEADVQQSKGELEQRLGVAVTSFSVPFGREDPRLDDVLRRAGYKTKMSNQLARELTESGLRTLPSAPVYQDDSVWEVRKRVLGSYDWLVAFQRRWTR